MAFQKFTQCIKPDDFSFPDYLAKLTFTDLKTLTIIASILGLLAVGAVFPPGALVGALLLVIGYCEWWLYKRLICLGGTKCAIGLLVSVEPPDQKSGLDKFDTDYSINLLLAPHSIGSTQNDIESDGIQGDLIAEQSATADKKNPVGAKEFPFAGHTVPAGADGAAVVYQQAVFHCEFEGGGVKKLEDAAKAALPFAAAAAAFCAIPIPIFTIICAILAAVAAIITLVGIGSALADKGDPNDVNPKLDELQRHVDLLFIKGEWVFDSAHEGWNELHPVTHCQRIGAWKGTWDSADEWADHYEDWSKSSQPPDLPPPPGPPPPPPAPTALLNIDPSNTVGGKPLTATLFFSLRPSVAGNVLISTDQPAFVTLPSSVAVVAGQSEKQFTIVTKPVTARMQINITATFAGASDSVQITLRPVPTQSDWKTLIQGWCDMVTDASSALTVANQNNPENQWTIHPLIDGCQTLDGPPPPPPIH